MRLEFQRNDPAKAAEAFRGLTRSSKPGVRAGALLRLGRNLRKTGRSEEALQVYDELARLGPVGLMGLPAELVAQEARCSVLEAMGKREGLRQEASLMYSALQSGRLRLLRPAWEFHLDEARRWSGESELTEQWRNALVLSRAAEWIYDQWPAGLEPKGRRVLRLEARPVFISWTSTADQLASVLAGPDYLDAMWKNILRRHVRGALVDPEGQVVVGALDKNTPQAVRTTAATRLPWTLHVTSADPGADLALSAARRRLLLSGFGVLALVLLAGSYFIMRSIERERAVARLQSEFVSAVSHEFRTPAHVDASAFGDAGQRESFPRKSCGSNPMIFSPAKANGCSGSSSRCWISAALGGARVPLSLRGDSIPPHSFATLWPNSRRRLPPRGSASRCPRAGSTRSSGPIARRSAWRCGTCSTTP